MLKLEHIFIYLFIVFSLTGMGIHAQNSTITLITSSSNFQTTEIEFELGDYQLKSTETKNGIANVILVEGGIPLLRKGAPDLPKFTTSIIIPSNSLPEIEIISAEYEDIQETAIAPSLGNYYRNEPLTNKDREYLESYLNAGFFPNIPAELNESFNFKGFNGQRISFQPFLYDASSEVLRIYKRIKIRVLSRNPENSNLIKHTRSDDELFKKCFLNYPIGRNASLVFNERLVIVSASEFIPELDEFINLKKRLGFDIEIINADKFSEHHLIKMQLQHLYQANPFQYILIIGDAEQVPSPIIHGGAADPTYGFLLGEDAYPEAFVGRLSAENISELKSQLDKIITYQEGSVLSNLSNLVGIASELGPGDNQEFDFEHIRNINNQLLISGYSHAVELFDGTQGGGDAIGNPSVMQVNEAMNNGTGLLFYAGHGTKNSFTTSGYSVDDVTLLNNINSFPFICSVACLNGDFINGTCLAESFLRAKNNNQPTGAIAAYMSSVNQSWNPPMSAQDEMANIISGNYSEVNNYTLGNICALSNLKMLQDYGIFGQEMATNWLLFGDPSLMLRTRTPQQLSAIYPTNIQINTSSIDVSCNVENALISIIQNDILIGTGLISNGTSTVEINRLQSLDSLEIVVSAFNYLPNTGWVNVLPSDQAFIIIKDVYFNDTLGNYDLQLDYSEQIYLEFKLSNLGLQTSDSIHIQLVCPDSSIQISNFSCVFEQVNSNHDILSNSCIEFIINSFVEDQSLIQFELIISEGNNLSFSQLFKSIIRAPKIVMTSIEIDELTGNNNGRADPGETVLLKISNTNVGQSTSPNGIASISCNNSLVDLGPSSVYVDSIYSNQNHETIYQLSIPENVENGTNIVISYEMELGVYTSSNLINLKIGTQIEDAESNDFNNFPWNNSRPNAWIIDNSIFFDGNTSFKSANIFGGSSSELSIQITSQENDSIRFYYKVSSELNWDLLSFYIDDAEYQSWSGEINWEYASFPINSGTHELKWIYSKDNVVSSGLDAAWIDQIEFPLHTQFINSIIAEAPNDDMMIYPNPSNGQINIRGINIDAINKIQLFDIRGKMLVDDLETADNLILIPNTILSGVYLLTINNRYFKIIYSPK